MKVSVIIPVLNEESVLIKNLPAMQWIRESGHELIVVDGGSIDNSVHTANKYVDKVIKAKQGRAAQMNSGAGIASGDLLLFLHADTVLPESSNNSIFTSPIAFMNDSADKLAHLWGRFNVRLSGNHFMLRIIEYMMNKRSCVTGIATGDQAIFISKDLFKKIRGYREIPLMEDIEICRRLKKINRPVCHKGYVITSSRRWETSGIYRTILLMWRIRFSYWLGVDPAYLAKQYNS